ncbi:HetP family heterocyst commitment protein [Fortiea contorta]|uniref:HetP family heterocyst commitment protein n=1 Tax=Fortiea contorta TaxID=1892405 RepID=UPI000346E4F2|nr:HetP family heterocyst commitment protein [Fortiea contorta]
MNPENIESNQPTNKIIQTEQVEQIIKAVLAGKYSWACVLFLHFVGYNPIKYIPYRTYIRLLKNNCLLGKNHNNKNVEFVEIKSEWMQINNTNHGAN